MDNQLPFVSKLLAPLRKKSKSSEDDDDEVDEEVDEEEQGEELNEEPTEAERKIDQLKIDELEDGTSEITAKDLKPGELDESLDLDEIIDEDSDIDNFDSDEEDEDEDEEAEGGLKGKIAELKNLFAKKFSKKSNKASADASDEEDESEDGEEDGDKSSGKGDKRKFQLKPIHIGIIVILGVFVLYDEEETTSPQTTPPKTVKTTKQQNNLIPKNTEVNPKKVNDTSVNANTNTIANTKVENNNINPINKDTTSGVQEAKTETKNVDTMPTGDEFTRPKTITEVKETESKINPDKDNKKNETDLDNLFANDDLPKPEDVEKDKKINTNSTKQNTASGDTTQDMNQTDGQADIVKANNVSLADTVGVNNYEVVDLTNTDAGISSDILENLEKKVKQQKKKEKFQMNLKPTAAPDYNDIGRALVYNCKGQHWACVSEVRYKECGQNYDWNMSQQLSVDCYPVEVYVDDFDCEKVQQFKIDSVAETNFCNAEGE